MSSSIARIHVNGIEVGSLPVEIYNTIAASVRQDRRLYLAYAVRILGVGLRMLLWGTCAVPVFLMMALVFLLIVEPASITDLIATTRVATPEAITAGLRATVLYTWIGMIVLIPTFLALFTPGYIAFNNPFTDAINRRVRSMLEVPTEGPLSVFIENPSTPE
ncbi:MULTISPECIES: hypothetical protein [Pseudomonas]|uniref:hypothetical protein n=1 Tax=Pseudomonas TaxID=286 RepID=UPI000C32928B|nr:MULTISPECIES: hypothetical protein [Pseudomonas]PWC98978.1 hypothetical protein CX658_30825 [Pseudomonas amygdali pv. lachrymans]WNZ87393.1 hypothetical protein QOM10_31055 [Pseudomonas sp. P108]